MRLDEMVKSHRKDSIDAMKNAAEILAVDSEIISRERNKIEQAKYNLNQLNGLLDDSINDEIDFLEQLENSLKNPGDFKNALLLEKLEIIGSRQIPNLEGISLIDSMEISYDWKEAVRLNQEYAKAYQIDLKHPFIAMFSSIELVEISKQVAEEFELLELDKLDYAFAASAGLIAGFIDAIFVGSIKSRADATGLQKSVDKAFDKIVELYGKHERIAELTNQQKKAKTDSSKQNIQNSIDKVKAGIVSASKNGEIVEREWTKHDSIKWLEKYNKVGYDAATNLKDGSFHIPGMSPDNHHLLSLAHEPSLFGLLIGIVDQITGKSTFIGNDGLIQRIVTDNVNKELSGNMVTQITQACENWFGHIMSDIAGSSGSKGRGSGLPVPGWAALQKLQFGHINYNERHSDVTIAELSELMFKKGYDVRSFSAQLIPVLVYETLLRCYWLYKQHFYYGKDLKESVPIANNRELARLLLISAGSFSTIDVTHAVIKSMPGSPQFIAEFIMTVNLPGLVDLGFRSFQNIRNEVSHRKHVENIYENDILIEYNRVMSDPSVL